VCVSDATKAVREFHIRVGAPIATKPTLLRGDAGRARRVAERVGQLAHEVAVLAEGTDPALQRAALALEELSEWLDAHARGDLAAAADAWADRLYVLLGDAVAAGLPAEELFATVHASNLSKEPADGRGKAGKGPDYQPPDLRKALGLRGHAADRGLG
jgi:predicted HAD superfamily Cof-like phosphohydrolase